MASVLHRRMARLEAALMPLPEQGFTVLIEPDFQAPDSERQMHCQKIEDARVRSDRIGVVRSPDYADTDQPESGIEYFDTEFHAWLVVLSSQRSEKGKANRLADVMASLNGNVLGVVPNPTDSEDAP